jgi:branched-chain amino acid transport system permease protein
VSNQPVADPWPVRAGRVAGASGVLFVALTLAAFVYTSTGGGARTLLVEEMLVNLILVLGLQVFIGNTGVLSFGHMGFVQIAAYTTALVSIPVATKASALPRLPFGLADVAMGPLAATVTAIVVTTLIGAVIGVAIARAKGLSATMITLAVLFVVDQVVKNWEDLTRGAGGLSGVPRLSTGLWLWVSVLLALVVAHGFSETRLGRLTVATREDELAAPALGIRVPVTRYVAWTLSIALVALAGSLRAQQLGSVNPKQFTLDAGILILVMLVVGGMRTVSGAVLGTVVITVGTELFRQLGDPQRLNIQRFPDLFLGVVMLATMLLRPRGILADRDLAGWLRLRTRCARRTTVSAESTDRRDRQPLVASDVLVRFGGFLALNGASVRVEPGQVVGLIGPNGAGKTTMFNVVTGLVEAEGGRISLGELDLSDAPPHRRARAGLARTFQNLRLFKDLSVRENVAIAALVAERHRTHRRRLDVDTLLDEAGLTEVGDRPASTLDYGNQRRLELARAAALAPEFLLLDEPTSGMDDSESLAMVDRVRRLAERLEAGVLVIDHDLGFITRICDHVVVLTEGEVLTEGTPDQVRADPRVAAAYLGTQA